MLVEIGAGQGAAVREKAEATPGLTDIEIRRDYAGHDRILVARRETV